MIDCLRTSGERKIQLTMKVGFILSKDRNEICNDTDEIIEKPFQSPPHTYQIALEQSIRGSEFVFDHVDGLHFKCHRVSLNLGRSCIDSPKWIKSKRVTINPNDNVEKRFQYAITVTP